MARDQDFSPRLLGLRREPPAPLPRIVAGLLVLFLVGLGIWAAVGHTDIVARAQGELVPQSRLKVVQPMERSRVAAILVQEGDRVDEGQPLLRLDPSLSRPDVKRFREQLELARLRRRRIRAALGDGELQRKPSDDPELFAEVRAEHVSARRAYRDRLAERKAELRQAHKELEAARAEKRKAAELVSVIEEVETAYQELARSDAVPRLDILERKQRRIEAERELRAQRRRVEELRQRVNVARTRIERLRSERRERLVKRRNDLTARILELQANYSKEHARSELLTLKAPRAGIVKNVRVSTEGAVAPAGTRLMSLVPEGEPLKAAIRVGNRDIGFVNEGMDVALKLAAYPFQRFGTVKGVVERVSPDASTPRSASNGRPTSNGTPGGGQQASYEAIVRLERQKLEYEGETLKLRPGMRVVAELDLGERSVLEYVISPVSKTLDYAGKGR